MNSEAFTAFFLAAVVIVGGIWLVSKWIGWTNNAVNDLYEQTSEYRKNANGKPFCPNCGSIDLSANNRGYSMVTGTVGSKNVYVTCIKCGHRWKAGQYNYLYK